MDKDILSVSINLKVSRYGPPPAPPKVVVELNTAEKALEIFEKLAKEVQYVPRSRD